MQTNTAKPFGHQASRQTSRPIRRVRGFTLIEACTVIATSAIAASQAVPAMGQWRQQQRLQTVAQTVYTDIQQARSQAVLGGGSVFMRFSEHRDGTCYVMHTGSTAACECDATGRAVCEPEAQAIKVEWLPRSTRLAVRANVSSLNFQPRQGTVSSTGSVEIAMDGGPTIREVVSITGRVRHCVAAGQISGMPAC